MKDLKIIIPGMLMVLLLLVTIHGQPQMRVFLAVFLAWFVCVVTAAFFSDEKTT